MIKHCEHCTKDFEAKRTDKRFCSASCRSKASIISRAHLGETPGSAAPAKPARMELDTKIPGTDVRTQYVIDSLTREVDRFEKQYNSETAESKRLRDEVASLKEIIVGMKTDAKIAEIEGTKKSALEGLGENPIVLKILEHAGPAIGAMAMKLVEGNAAPQMQGIDPSNPGVIFLQWLSQKNEAVQRSVLALLQGMEQIQDENILMMKLGQIQSLVMGDHMRRAG
jgi:hypothetical protein